MGYWFQIVIVSLIDPIAIGAGIVAGIAMRAFGFWAGLPIIIVVPILRFWDIIQRELDYKPDYLMLAGLLTAMMAGIAIWSVIGRWLAFTAVPRKQEYKNPLA